MQSRAELGTAAQAVVAWSAILKVLAPGRRVRAMTAIANRLPRVVDSPVTVVLPVRNAGPRLDAVLAAIRAQTYIGPMEVIAVDDGSIDGSGPRLAEAAREGRLRVLTGPARGAA